MDEEQVKRLVTERGWTFVGIGFFVPEYDPTVDAFGPDGLEIRAYVPAYYGDNQGPPSCEVTDMNTEMSLWVVGVPDAAQVGRLMEEHEEILVHTALGVGDYVLDLESGEVVPECEANR